MAWGTVDRKKYGGFTLSKLFKDYEANTKTYMAVLDRQITAANDPDTLTERFKERGLFAEEAEEQNNDFISLDDYIAEQEAEQYDDDCGDNDYDGEYDNSFEYGPRAINF